MNDGGKTSCDLHTVSEELPNWNFFSVAYVRARLHQASASMQSQHCDEADDTALIEINGIA